MGDKVSVKQAKEECSAEGKAQYLQTAGGNITCLRCTAQSTRTKLQCGRPAIKTSRTQKCQYHGGRPHTKESLRRISERNTVHGQSSKVAKQKYKHESVLMHELEDAVYFLEMAQGPRTPTAKAPIAVVIRQLDQPSCNFFILCIKLSLVAVTRLTDPKGLAGHPNANAALLDCFDGHLLTSGWPHHFFLEPTKRSRP